ncbi:MAG: HAMP domain-containing sensor histidine kinase [Candidatus Izemoplasmatales bacterium]|jgi:signal transduction histidine kinase|nr:HAMP domain-containing sensor histidine kinase [Candidatus Izemoplasmatales bacterium]MDD3865389.1 HAMP domain-containing sensor histidine kinase [Candidatus Izemoplasmatales bacterium]
MKIRIKQILYFAILLIISFFVAVMLTRYFLTDAIDRLVYSNVVDMNKNIVKSLDGETIEELVEDFETVKGVTGVEMMVYTGDTMVHSTFDVGFPDLSTAIVSPIGYEVYTVYFEGQEYYYTSELVTGTPYRVLIFRGPDLVIEEDRIFYAGFIGIAFLILSISTVSFFSTRSLTKPINELAEYANHLNPDAKPEPRPVFSTFEFNELGIALEKASTRLYDYRQSEQEFLHNFSHEMKSPLTNIYGYAEAMKYNMLSDEESKNACSIIMAESEKLKDTINQILLLGRLDSIQEAFHFQRINIVDVISDAMNAVQMAAKDAKIDLNFHNAEENHYLTGDPERLETAFTNILSNGIRYAKTQIAISISSGPNYLRIIFEDDGPGIPEMEREKVFERYYTGYKGHTGLGLTIVKAIADHHNATVKATESADGGARFVIAFPQKKTEANTKPEKKKRGN